MPTSDPLYTSGMIMIEKHYTNECQKKAGVAILVSEKIHLKKVHNKRQRRTLYNSKGYNPKRRYNNCKYIPQLSGIYSQATKVVQYSQINVIQYVNRKDENHMIRASGWLNPLTV